MEFSNSFQVPVPNDQAWPILMDVARIAPCLPGAAITEIIDPETFKGTVSLRLGPMVFDFSGTAKIVERDDQNFRATVAAKGNDAKGRGGAQATVKFGLEPTSKGTSVQVHTVLQLSGSVAQFGRGSAIISSVAAQLIRQFERSLGEQLTSAPGSGGTAPPPQAPRRPIGLPGLVLSAAWNGLRNTFATIFRLRGRQP
jgi:carbon monoxide dehydrogenase subunit G